MASVAVRKFARFLSLLHGGLLNQSGTCNFMILVSLGPKFARVPERSRELRVQDTSRPPPRATSQSPASGNPVARPCASVRVNVLDHLESGGGFHVFNRQPAAAHICGDAHRCIVALSRAASPSPG